MARQLTFDDITDRSEGLLCRSCGEHSVVMTSTYSPLYSCYYNHAAVCSKCGDAVYPTGVKSFILDNWEDSIRMQKQYFKIKGWL